MSSTLSEFGSMTSMNIEKVKLLPLPTPSDCANMLPPFYSTISLHMRKPRPSPSEFKFAVRCNFPKRVNSESISLAFMPMPVSQH